MENEFATRIGNIRMKDSVSSRSLMLGDGLMNIASGLGGGLDPQAHAFYAPSFGVNQVQIDNAFKSSPFFKKVVVGPATDAVRAWRTFEAEDADITGIETEERRIGLRDKIREAEISARLYGGSVILIGTNDVDTSLPLDPSSVEKGGLRYLNVVSRYDISIPNLILDPGSPFYLQPDRYIINGGDGRQVDFHPSRVVRFNFGDLPTSLLRENQGWGSSLLEVLWNTLVNVDTAQGSVAALLSKLKIDTVYLPGLTEMASTSEGEEMIKRRFVVAKMFESLLSVKLMDAPATSDGVGEKWEQFVLNVSGYPELMVSFVQMLAGAADYPLTRLLGTAPGGLQNTGAADEQNYDRMISARQELSLRPRFDMIDAVLVPSAIGSMPPSYSFSFNPLTVDSDAVKATNAKARADATQIYVTNGVVPIEVMQEAVKNQLIESGEYPGIENAYDEYAAGNLDPIVEVEEAPEDPLIPVDPTTGAPTQNRESRLFGQRQAAANDRAAKFMADGMPALTAFTEAMRLTDATPRSLYVSRSVLNRDDFEAWAAEQGIGELQPDLHVTITYSRDPVDWLKMGSSWADRDQDGTGNLTVTSGGPRVVEPLGDRTAVLMFASTDLQWRHEEMVRSGASHDYPDYIPHISLTDRPVDLSRVKPYRGKIELGPEIFEEIKSEGA